MDIEPQYLIISTNLDETEEHNIQQIPVTSAVHILPASIKPKNDLQHHDADVSAYFTPLIRNDEQTVRKESEQDEQLLENSLLGHKIKGKVRRDIQCMFQCNINKEDANLEICLLRRLEGPVEWRKDHQWGNNQGRLATIRKYCQIQQALHGKSQ